MTVHPADDPLARWLAEADSARADPSGQRIWRLYDSAPFAHLWYSARDAGERMRAAALAHLYAQQAHPGGPYPDPRDPDAAFSQQAVISTAASQMRLTVAQRTRPADLDSNLPSGPLHTSSQPASQSGPQSGPESGMPIMRQMRAMRGEEQPQAWLVTYPPTQQSQQPPMPPLIMIYLPRNDIPQERINFELACMLGYVSREAPRLLDPYAPPGISVMPTSPSAVAILHQFAIALLCLDIACPKQWRCHCNTIRARFNAPPASHAQSTDTLSLAELAHETQAQQATRRQGQE